MEETDDLKKQIKTFKSNYEEVLLKVLVDSASISTFKKDVDFIKSDAFSERIGSESMDAIHRLRNSIIYDTPENQDPDVAIKFIKAIFQ